MSLADLDRRIDYLESRLIRAERELAMRPVKPPKGAANNDIYVLVIGGGNTLSDGTTRGIKNSASAVSTVPSIYNPALSPACIDGIGYATLYKNNASQGAVLVCNYNGNGSPYQLALSANQIVITSTKTISIPLASDPTQAVTCYVPYTP